MDDDETSRDNDERLVLYWERLKIKGVKIRNSWPREVYVQKRALRLAMEAEADRVTEIFMTTLGAHRPEDYDAIATYLRNFHWLTTDGQAVRRVELTAVDGLLTLRNKPLQRDWATLVSDFYARYNPEKNNPEHIATVLAKYAGREDELLGNLYRTYNIEPE